jgi:hypothetical protein
MRQLDRRTLLGVGGAALGTLLAGCVESGGSDDESTPESESDDGSTSQDDGSGSADGTSSTVDSVEQTPLATNGQPAWAEDSDSHVSIHADTNVLDESAVGELSEQGQSEAQTFIEETDFESERLVVVGGKGPNGCYDSLELGEFSVEDGTLTGSATVSDADSGEGTVCTQVITPVQSVVRVTFSGEPVDAAEVTLTDGWDENVELTADI